MVGELERKKLRTAAATGKLGKEKGMTGRCRGAPTGETGRYTTANVLFMKYA